MEDFMETIYAQEANEVGCKTCKNKPKLLTSWATWFGVWMFIMSIYGNFVFFKQIINFVFG
jgi:hypothetical protein